MNSAHGKTLDRGNLSKRNRSISVSLVSLLIGYGSLYPLTWNFETPQEFIIRGSISFVDVVENIILFMPLGWLLAWHYCGQPNRWLTFVAWFLITLGVVSVLQWLQKYLPRTPQLSDIIMNMVGYLGGWWAGMISACSLDRVLQRYQILHSADRVALLMLGVWLVAELFPLVPTFDVSSIFNNFKSLWQQDAWQPRRMLLHAGMTVIGLEALAHLIRSASLDRFTRRFAGVATLVMLAGKFVVVDQSPGLAVAFGITGGALAWFWVDHFGESRRLATLLIVATASYLVHAIWPLQLRDPPEPMLWLPFASALSGSIEPVITSVAFECLCFGAIIWSVVWVGSAPGSMIAVLALLAFACEWEQRYLPTRTPEITSVILVLGMGWLVASLTKCSYQKRRDGIS